MVSVRICESSGRIPETRFNRIVSLPDLLSDDFWTAASQDRVRVRVIPNVEARIDKAGEVVEAKLPMAVQGAPIALLHLRDERQMFIVG